MPANCPADPSSLSFHFWQNGFVVASASLQGPKDFSLKAQHPAAFFQSCLHLGFFMCNLGIAENHPRWVLGGPAEIMGISPPSQQENAN